MIKHLFKDEGWKRLGKDRGDDASGGADDAIFGVWWRRTVVREDPWEALRREIDRSRRHGHALTLLRLAPSHSGRGARRAREALIMLRQVMRSVDSVWSDRDGIFMLLPESDREAADGLLERLRDAVPDLVPEDGVRSACFPSDGLTANALRAAVNRTLDGPSSLPVGPGQPARVNGDRPDDHHVVPQLRQAGGATANSISERHD